MATGLFSPLSLRFAHVPFTKKGIQSNQKFFRLLKSQYPNKMAQVTVSDNTLVEKSKQLAPALVGGKHKGQAGRIGVFGGSVEFTGAPYFSSISALKVGADLSYVFTIKDAAFVIKSYSPELMVLPFLDDQDAIQKITPWIERLHVALIGPGLGRLESTQKVFEAVVNLCRSKQIPLLIDADGLIFVSKNPDIIKNYPRPVILTPNKMEFRKIIGDDVNANDPKVEQARKFLERVGPNVTLFCKDMVDEIITLGNSIQVSITFIFKTFVKANFQLINLFYPVFGVHYNNHKQSVRNI
ncbi:hypothetical protein ABEB36_007015 [Hypothenemus hampei]|uniref:ATP-dependent (S)-NAD(P)H-hydrate dehydratase n=1 Tax=Hypothenemus hampei TaxID=57062 RepID=A0ABD1ESH3_HYPHA